MGHQLRDAVSADRMRADRVVFNKLVRDSDSEDEWTATRCVADQLGAAGVASWFAVASIAATLRAQFDPVRSYVTAGCRRR